MLTVKNKYTYTYEIQKSKFTSVLLQVNSLKEVECYLKQIKNEYPNATHYCYSYKIDQLQKFSDDKEPNGTAGLPIMEVLNKNNLDHILCIVVRYFGGIKLGSGGLLRAYLKATREVINQSDFIELVPGYIIQITLPYIEQKSFEYQFSSYITEKSFTESITYLLTIPKNKINLLKPYSYKILKEQLVTLS